MALTRATGKAFRLGFSWIITLAGYEATPAEEMDGVIEGEFKPAPEPAAAQPAAAMSLATAMSVKNSEGTPYGEIPTDKLAHMANALTKALKDNGLEPADRDEKQYKRDAIAVILADRSGK